MKSDLEKTYNEFISDIINSRGQWSHAVRISDEGCERHHIIPVCMGGEPLNRNWSHHSNLIWLYPHEHLIAHALLAKENPDNKALNAAFIMMMSDSREGRELNILADDYERTRILAKNSFSGINHPFYGHTLTDDHKKSISNAQKGRIRTSLERDTIRINTLRQFEGSAKRNIENAAIPKYAARSINNHRNHCVICLETMKIYRSISEAYRETGFSSIKSVCRNAKNGDMTHVAGGYHWMYYEDFFSLQR